MTWGIPRQVEKEREDDGTTDYDDGDYKTMAALSTDGRKAWSNAFMVNEEEVESSSDSEAEPEDQPQEESDIDQDVPHAHGPRTTSEKRRAQNEILRQYVSMKTEQITEAEIKETIQGSKDEVLSIRDILAKQENSARITTPREYQTELFQRAKEDNVIAVLDTGSGKTHIATLLLRHVLDQEVENRAKGGPHKVAFFLVDSVNLVFQQANVLKCGLDHAVKEVCGASGVGLWQKQTWDQIFSDTMVVVSTAEVLVQCMMHSFCSMGKINLLIFDEAHHAKNNHPYARLMKDYYVKAADPSQLPKIFGMTASPVDANTNIKGATRQLEALLNSRIVTTSNLELLQSHVNKPAEEVVRYPKLAEEFETPLHQRVKSRYGDLDAFKKFFRMSKIVSSELGSWASDMYWSFVFTEHENRKIQTKQEFKFNKMEKADKAEGAEKVAKLDEEIARLKEAGEFVRSHNFGLPTATTECLSSKVLLLLQYLNLYYERTGEARCIVFVEKRQTARLLKLIFSHIGPAHLRCDQLTGINAREAELKISLRTQIMTVAAFRRGELNCLFSTSVAEEGLDIPQCNLVVRFDMYRTMISYVQSRGRARHRNSKYLHMVEQNNNEHLKILHDARAAETVMREFCSGLSGDRVLDDPDNDFNKYLSMDKDYRTYTDALSGAKLTYRSSLSVLAHFVASLPAPNQEVNLQPQYVIQRIFDKYRAEVVLPDYSPIINCMGFPYGKKIIAKCSAAFQMCIELRKKGFLDENLLPTTSKALPLMRNAHLAISERKKGQYPMRIKPEFWKQEVECVPECLYLTVIDVDAGLDRPHQPLGLLTRKKLPDMPQFPLYLTGGKETHVISVSLLEPIPITEGIMRLFTDLTLLIYQDIFNKGFEDVVSKFTYWIVPVRTDRIASATPYSRPKDLIDIDQVRFVCRTREYSWTPEMDDSELADRYIVDRGDGGRRFYSVQVVPNAKPQDPVPSFAPAYKHNLSILDYSCSLWTSARVQRFPTYLKNQPVMEALKIPHRKNLLALVEEDEAEVKKDNRCWLCPEPFRISALPTRLVAMCYAFPAIIHRFESYLIALDACNYLDLNIGPYFALEAITKDSENTCEHGEEKINFQSGMGPNYERLEFMGDCFLKMATSISVFVQKPDENEFEFHVRRMVMLCNQNLRDNALELGLVEYIRSKAFSRRTWYPHSPRMLTGKALKEAGTKQVIKHSLGDKSIADVCEALIGAAFMQHNIPGHWDPKNWDEAVKAVTLLVKKEDHLMEKWSDYYAAYELPQYQIGQPTATQLDLSQKIYTVHPYRFKYPRLLRSAFIHPSQPFMWELIPNYQRLEFLGDSLLDQVFIMYLFYRYPDKDPQWLTEHKMPMVSNKFLGAVCVDLDFYRHIRQNNSLLSAQIRDYVNELKQAEDEAKSKDDPKDAIAYWTTVSEPPKCLADVVEAFVAALFVDSKFDFNVVQDFFDRHLKKYFIDMSIYNEFANSHPTTRLSKMLTIALGCREWRLATLTSESLIPGAKPQVVAMVMIHNEVKFDGVAVSGRYARVKASSKACEALEGLPPYEYKRLYGCTCETDKEMEQIEQQMKEMVGPEF